MKPKIFLILTLTGLILFLFSPLNSHTQEAPWWKNWEKYENNPIIDSVQWFDMSWDPVVLHEDGKFKMWFTGWNWMYLVKRVGYAESTDGINWDIEPEPITPLPIVDDWNFDRSVSTILRIDDTLKMWYSASNKTYIGDSTNFVGGCIGYAWSVEENYWNWYPDPVLEKGDEGAWDDKYVQDGHVYYDGSTYHMYYFNGKDLGYATSPDGIHWEKDYENSPVLERTADSTWYYEWIRGGPITKTGDTLQMFVVGHDGSYSWSGYCLGIARTGIAWSTDYTNWNLTNNAKPVLGVGLRGEWDAGWAEATTVLLQDNQLKMWYTGYDRFLFIGYAEGIEVPYECMSGGITFNNQWQIDNFGNEYPFCSEIQGTVEISGSEITNLDGLRKVEIIHGDLHIHDNTVLEYLTGLDKLHTITGDLVVYSNDQLIDFTGLEELTYIGEDIRIIANESLSSLEGLDNVAPVSFKDLTIVLNSNLDDCSVKSLCYYFLNPNGSVIIEDNGPVCSDSTTIRQRCAPPVSINESVLMDNFVVHPNPFNDQVYIEYELRQPGVVTVSIVNHLGMLIKELSNSQQEGIQKIQLSTDDLSPGFYFCMMKVQGAGVGNMMRTVKIVKL